MDMSGTTTSPPPLGVGIGELRYRACGNITANFSGLSAFCSNSNDSYGVDKSPELLIEKVVFIVVPLLFGLIVLVGLFGNALVSDWSSCSNSY
jgi:hypothetical protein